MTTPNKTELEILAEVLEKTIDSQIESIKYLTELRKIAEEDHQLLKQIYDQFTNGFRSDIKDHTTDKVTELCNELRSRLDEHKKIAKGTSDRVETIISWSKKPSIWVGLIVSFLVATAAIMTAWSKFVESRDHVQPPQNTPVSTPHVEDKS